MNKKIMWALGIGLIVLVGVGYLVMRPPPSPPQSADPVSIAFTYASATPEPAKSVRVQAGQRVIVTVTSDIADEAHLHGYNLSAKLEPNSASTIEFAADKTGRFELELEKAGKLLGYIEVYP